MITIPTGDLTGLLSDVIPFAMPLPDLPDTNCVRIEWDGEMLHALATDRYRIAWATWHPDDQPEVETQDDLFTNWGGADEPWQLTLPLDDAKHLVKTFTLGKKEQRVPLTLDGTAYQVKVNRSKETGYSALTAVVQHDDVTFPNVREMLTKADTVAAITGTQFNAKYLADFAKVRARGPLELTFTGAESAALVTIGTRFTGAIMPVKVGSE